MNNVTKTTPAYLWFDSEFTSLNTSDAHLLQVALVATDIHLNRIFDGVEDINLCIRIDADAQVSPWVEENLADLLARCRAGSAISLHEADLCLATYAARASCVSTPAKIDERAVLAGNSVYMDLAIAKRLLPVFCGWLHYRLLDVSAIKTVWSDWRLGVAFDKENRDLVQASLPMGMQLPSSSEHDALYDVFASIAELNFFRSALAVRCTAQP